MKFTVEELALKVQQGEKEYMPQLLESVNCFISMQARRTLNGYPDHYKALLPDMVNEAYFALLKAVQDFEAGKGMFLTYLGYHIKNAFTTVLYCGRGIRHKNDPLNTASSLDEPLKDSEELTLVDMLIDDTAEAYYRTGKNGLLDHLRGAGLGSSIQQFQGLHVQNGQIGRASCRERV